MTFAIIFVIAFIAIGALGLYLSRTIDHGEARFDASGKMISEREPEPEQDQTVQPARRIEQTDTTGDQI